MINTAAHPRHMPTPSLLLLLKFLQAANPVTKAVYKEAIERRIERGEFG